MAGSIFINRPLGGGVEILLELKSRFWHVAHTVEFFRGFQQLHEGYGWELGPKDEVSFAIPLEFMMGD